jgi:hypothetical protein
MFLRKTLWNHLRNNQCTQNTVQCKIDTWSQFVIVCTLFTLKNLLFVDGPQNLLRSFNHFGGEMNFPQKTSFLKELNQLTYLVYTFEEFLKNNPHLCLISAMKPKCPGGAKSVGKDRCMGKRFIRPPVSSYIIWKVSHSLGTWYPILVLNVPGQKVPWQNVPLNVFLKPSCCVGEKNLKNPLVGLR